MTDNASPTKNPELLLEAARVLNVAGPPYENAAVALALAALQARDLAGPEVRDAITGDVAALYLSRRLSGGYEEALALLKPVDDAAADSDKNGRLHLLRALAKGQKYRALVRAKAKLPQGRADTDAELETLKTEIRKDLEIAFARTPALKQYNRVFWDPDSEMVDFVEDEADLHAVYKDDAEFRKLVDPPELQPKPAVAPELQPKPAVEPGRSDTNKVAQ
jgi:hypothetical protein